MKSPKFEIGDWVKIKASVYLEYDKDDVRQIKRTPMVRVGQICGAKRKMLGKYIDPNEWRHDYSDRDYDAPYLEVKGSIIIWIIRTGYLNKPIEAMEEDVEVIESKELALFNKNLQLSDLKLPWLYKNESVIWTESDRQDMRDNMKDAPRDSKGRWIK